MWQPAMQQLVSELFLRIQHITGISRAMSIQVTLNFVTSRTEYTMIRDLIRGRFRFEFLSFSILPDIDVVSLKLKGLLTDLHPPRNPYFQFR